MLVFIRYIKFFYTYVDILFYFEIDFYSCICGKQNRYINECLIGSGLYLYIIKKIECDNESIKNYKML